MRARASFSTERERNNTPPIYEFSESFTRKPERVFVEVRNEGEKQSCFLLQRFCSREKKKSKKNLSLS